MRERRSTLNLDAVSSIALNLVEERTFQEVLPTSLRTLEEAHPNQEWLLMERRSARRYRAVSSMGVHRDKILELAQLAVGEGVKVDGRANEARCDLGTPVWQRAGWVGGEPQIVLAVWSPTGTDAPRRVELHQAAHMILESYRNAFDYEKLRLGNRRDTLTGLYDNQRIRELVHREALRARRHRLPMSIVLLDVENFQYLNDVYGRAAGDQVLLKLSQILRHELRKEDAIGRMSGDQFLIVLGRTNNQEAQLIQTRLREHIESKPISLGCHRVSVKLRSSVASLGECVDGQLVETACRRLQAQKDVQRKPLPSAHVLSKMTSAPGHTSPWPR